MTFIQNSIIETQPVSLVGPVKESDSGDGFEAMLDAVVLEDPSQIASQTLDSNNLIAEHVEELPKLESDICVLEQELPMHSLEIMMQKKACRPRSLRH